MAEMKGKAKSKSSEERFWRNFNKALDDVPYRTYLLCNVLKCAKIDQKLMERIVDRFFESAISNPEHISSYGVVCKKLFDRCNTRKFRHFIVARCVSELKNCSTNEKLWVTKGKEIEECTDPEKKKELQALHEKEGKSLRMRPIGTISLLNALWLERIVQKNIMHLCIKHLLQHRHEENLEFLYKLLMERGKQLDSKGDLGKYFMQIQLRIKDEGPERISSRVREMLQELTALRATKWIPKSCLIYPELLKLTEMKEIMRIKIHPHEKPLYEEVRCILDNYDSKNIDTVASKLKSLPIEPKWLQEVLLEKAFHYDNFTTPCVLLCKKLSSMEVPGTDVKNESWKDFEKTFASDCVHEFDYYLKEAEVLKMERFSPETIKANTYASLIGALFCENLVSREMVDASIKFLLENITAENLERLCTLLDNISRRLVYFENLENYVDDLQKIVDERDSASYSEDSYELLEKILKKTKKMFHEMS